MGENINILDYVQKGVALKKFAYQLLEQKYGTHQELLDRVSHYLVTDKDVEGFTKLLADAYEVGYMKAVNDYQDQLAKLNIKVKINQKNLGGNQ